MDIFSLPEMALLSCVVDHFLRHGLEFDQAHLYKDVTVRTVSGVVAGEGGRVPSPLIVPPQPPSPQDAIRDVHVKGLMYQWIEQDMGKDGSQRGQPEGGHPLVHLHRPLSSPLSEKYILRGEETFAVLSRLVTHGKQLFLITNSPFSFV